MFNEHNENQKMFHRKRKVLIDSINLEDYIDDPLILMGRQRFTSYLSRIKIFEMISNVPGSIVECGVHKGGSLMLYYHLCSILEPYGINRKIFGFDTFEGFRSLSSEDNSEITESMFSKTDFGVLSKAIEIHDLDRAVPHITKCELIPGDATKTIPEFIKLHPELIISLLYLDFDIYEPTKVALEHFLPLVPKGGIVVLDELNCQKWVGETKALKERFDLNKIKLKKLTFDTWPSYFVVGE